MERDSIKAVSYSFAMDSLKYVMLYVLGLRP